MLELEDAVARILRVVPPALPEPVPLHEACGRVLLENVAACFDLPPFDNSAMDGYAVRAQDVAAATREAPVRLTLVGQVAAGETFEGRVSAGAAVRVFTGSAMPAGADCVVMQEDTRAESDSPTAVLVLESARPWENVRFHGEDVRAGATLAPAGQALRAGSVSLLAAAGIAEVVVGARPVVGIVATGSELQEPGQPLSPGHIYESNRVGLAALVRAAGCKPLVFPVVPDNLELTLRAFSDALSQCSMVLTVGGASVGDFDLVKPALTQLQGQLEFWKVAIKPGRPFVFGQALGKPLFGLPGNPVSALVTFLLLVRPALRRWQGATDTELRTTSGVLGQPISNLGSRRHFVRVRFAADGMVQPAGTQASHLLSSFAAAHGLIDVPAESALPAGSVVAVKMWDF